MLIGILATILVSMATLSRAKDLDQCHDIPAPLEFYRGEPDDFGLAALTGVFEQLFKSLSQVLSSLPSRNDSDLYSFNFSELFNWNDTAEVTEEQSSTTVVPTTLKPLVNAGLGSFNVGHFLRNILPSHILPNSTAEELTQHQFGLPASTPNPINHIHNFLGGLKSTTAPQLSSLNLDNDDNATWGLVVPANAIRLQVAKLNQSTIIDSFELNAEQLHNSRNKLNRKKFVRNIDLSDFNVESDLFYIVCVNLAVIQEGQSRECQRCDLIKTCSGANCQPKEKVIDFQATTSRVHPYDARLHFYIHDLPLANISLLTRVQPRQVDLRCPVLAVYKKPQPSTFHQSPDIPNQGPKAPNRAPLMPDTLVLPETFDKFERLDRLQPYSILYVEVEHLSPKQAYKVEGDLSIGFDGAGSVPFGWPVPLAIKNYFGDGLEKEYIMGACSRPF